MDEDAFSSFFPSYSALERDTWESISRQMQAMEKEATDILSSSRLAEEAERARLLQDMKPGTTGNTLSYYSEQHGSHYHSWSSASVTVWSTTQAHDVAPVVQSEANWLTMAACALAAVYVGIGALFRARYSETRFYNTKRWQLVALWPFLWAANSKFRSELKSALNPAAGNSPAEKPKLQNEDRNST